MSFQSVTSDVLKGIAGLFGIDTAIQNAIDSGKEKEAVELLKKISKLRLSRDAKIEDLEKVATYFDAEGISIPGPLSKALAAEKRMSQSKLNELKNKNDLATSIEERLINETEKDSNWFDDSQRKQNISHLKENVNAIQKEFSEERV